MDILTSPSSSKCPLSVSFLFQVGVNNCSRHEIPLGTVFPPSEDCSFSSWHLKSGSAAAVCRAVMLMMMLAPRDVGLSVLGHTMINEWHVVLLYYIYLFILHIYIIYFLHSPLLWCAKNKLNVIILFWRFMTYSDDTQRTWTPTWTLVSSIRPCMKFFIVSIP